MCFKDLPDSILLSDICPAHNLELLTVLPPPPEYWDYRYPPAHPVCEVGAPAQWSSLVVELSRFAPDGQCPVGWLAATVKIYRN